MSGCRIMDSLIVIDDSVHSEVALGSTDLELCKYCGVTKSLSVMSHSVMA